MRTIWALNTPDSMDAVRQYILFDTPPIYELSFFGNVNVVYVLNSVHASPLVRTFVFNVFVWITLCFRAIPRMSSRSCLLVGALTTCTVLGCHRVYDLHINPQHPMEKLDTHSSGQAWPGVRVSNHTRSTLRDICIQIQLSDTRFRSEWSTGLTRHKVTVHPTCMANASTISTSIPSIYRPCVFDNMAYNQVRPIPSVSSFIGWSTVDPTMWPALKTLDRPCTRLKDAYVPSYKIDDIGDRSRKWPAQI
jgi:hypothetical protein